MAQHGIHRAALHLVVASPDFPLGLIGGLLGIVGDPVPLRLELGDRRLELGDRGADVRELDHVGLRRGDQLTQLGQGVGNPLRIVEVVRELGQDPGGQRDVAQLELHPGRCGERLEDRQQGLGGQGRGFVGPGVDDLHGHRTLPSSSRVYIRRHIPLRR